MIKSGNEETTIVTYFNCSDKLTSVPEPNDDSFEIKILLKRFVMALASHLEHTLMR